MAFPPDVTSSHTDSADALPTPPIAPRTKQQKIMRYLLNTGLSFGVTLGGTAVLHEGLGASESLAYAVALVVAFLMNFLMFRYYVFDGRTEHPGRQLVVFAGSSVAFRLIEWLGFNLLTQVLGVYYLAAIVLVQGGTFVLKYFVYGRWLFKRSTSPSKEKTIA